MARIGIYGGTFNPIHIGHLICAQEVQTTLGLDRVLVVPAGIPPHKPMANDPGSNHRLAMVRLATADDPRLECSSVEVDREGPSYTAVTLEILAADYPEDELTLIVGGDAAHSLPQWHSPSEILSRARLAVVNRAGFTPEAVTEQIEKIGDTEQVDFIVMPEIAVSSSAIRERVMRSLPIRYLVPDSVAGYIEVQDLYKGVR